MRFNLGEQRCGKHAHKDRKIVAWIKKVTRRARRRLEKTELENAPRQSRYRGWDD